MRGRSPLDGRSLHMMSVIDASLLRSRLMRTGLTAAFLLGVAPGLSGCSPESVGGASLEDDPNAITGELVTYVADFDDGHSERYQALRRVGAPEIRLDPSTP